MGCSNCGTNHNGLPTGCKNNGACGVYGCNKLDVFDWLSGTVLPDNQKQFDMVEIRFKNSRKGYFRTGGVELQVGSVAIVESSPGHDVGIVSLTGELVRLQLKRKGIKDNYEVKKVLRIARQDDIERWQEARKLEGPSMVRSREIARSLGLEMKISDVEYQGDKGRATFYYTADDRVDFRELIKRYADEFKVRIEMRQIGYRAEAGRIGGIGSCGRELCCSTWLTDFRSVSTSAARYQQLSLNPSKLAGQCGKLKCCLNYELDQYLEAFKDFPSTNIKLQFEKGTAFHFKTDVFRRLLYYIIDGAGGAPIALTVDAVKDIIEKNKKGQKVSDVVAFVEEQEVLIEDTVYTNVVGQDSLTRFDQKKNKKRPQGKPGGGGHRPQGERRTQGPGQPPAPRPEQRDQQRPPNGPKREGGGPPKPRPQGGGGQPQQGGERRGPRPQNKRGPGNQNRNRPPGKNEGNNPTPPNP